MESMRTVLLKLSSGEEIIGQTSSPESSFNEQMLPPVVRLYKPLSLRPVMMGEQVSIMPMPSMFASKDSEYLSVNASAVVAFTFSIDKEPLSLYQTETSSILVPSKLASKPFLRG